MAYKKYSIYIYIHTCTHDAYIFVYLFAYVEYTYMVWALNPSSPNPRPPGGKGGHPTKMVG